MGSDITRQTWTSQGTMNGRWRVIRARLGIQKPCFPSLQGTRGQPSSLWVPIWRAKTAGWVECLSLRL